MSGTVLAATVLALGISTGWEKLPDGGYQYIIQIEPEALDSLKSKKAIYSDILPSLRGIRSYEIRIGTDPLPHDGTPPPESAVVNTMAPPKPLSPDPTGRPVGSQPEQTAVFLENAPGESGPTATAPAPDKEPEKPWPVFMLVLAGLLGSVSGNLYLGWITWETRSRYRRLLRQSSGGERPVPSPEASTGSDDLLDDPLEDVEP